MKLQSVTISGSLARNARLDAPTCLVSSLWFSCGLAVSLGEAWKVSKQVLMPFWVARAALCDIPTCLITCRTSFCVAAVLLFVSFSQDELQFSWQVRHFGHLCRHFAWQAQHFRRVMLRVLWESHVRAPHSTLHT